MASKYIKQARELYGIDDWSAGYYSLDNSGHIVCHPNGQDSTQINLVEAVAAAERQGLSLPLILRFPQIITHQIERLNTAFQEAIWEYSYPGQHRGVFPFKVNQRREFIDNIVKCGASSNYGLEVGSKTEFLAALSYRLGPEALFICNGFKDEEFIELGFAAAAMNKNIIMVVEGPEELKSIIKLSEKYEKRPKIGARVKLYSRGSGKWAKSSGEASKFGLTTLELLECLDLLRAHDMEADFDMLHFHIGSQITEIKRIKNAIKEASRVFCKVNKMGFTPTKLDIGGGIGVDYDGSKTSFHSSANYSLKEFASDVVYQIGEVCRDEEIKAPDIITESGRVVAAYHSIVVTNIREIQNTETKLPLKIYECSEEQLANLHKNVSELKYILEHINRKNYCEYYHDAIEYYDEIFTLFNLGYLDLSERAIAEQIFYRICQESLRYSAMESNQPEEFEELQQRMVTKYLANFSIFQSIPDSWAIDQLFPVMPLSHHDKPPSHKASIVDITCDSDGCLERFIDRRDIRTVLDLHEPGDKPYYLGFFLVGAYQESLSNEHNLFGAINEAEIVVHADDSWEIQKATTGDPMEELLCARNYDPEEILRSCDEQLTAYRIEHEVGFDFLPGLTKTLQSLPYLSET